MQNLLHFSQSLTKPEGMWLTVKHICIRVAMKQIFTSFGVLINDNPFHLYRQVITDTHLLVGVFFVMLPDIVIYLVFLPLDIAVSDIGMEPNAEEPYLLNVGRRYTH